MKFLNENITVSLKQQQQTTSQLDSELQKVSMELTRLKDEYSSKLKELDTLDDANASVKAAKYERKIEELNRQLFNNEKQRTEFQNKLENMGQAFQVKLQLYVSDIRSNSQATQRELAQIADLMANLKNASDKQGELLRQRQQVNQQIHEHTEKQSLCEHLKVQIRDLDQMIEDAQVQINQIQDQIAKINTALDERQRIINSQIQQLNVIRQQKIDLDKEIELQIRQIQDLTRHIKRYEDDIERLTTDKEMLIDRLNELSEAVAKKIDEIEEMEALLQNKDKIIDIMNRRIKDKQS